MYSFPPPVTIWCTCTPFKVVHNGSFNLFHLLSNTDSKKILEEYNKDETSILKAYFKTLYNLKNINTNNNNTNNTTNDDKNKNNENNNNDIKNKIPNIGNNIIDEKNNNNINENSNDDNINMIDNK